VSDVVAGDITYKFVDYPALETDLTTGGTDTLSGYIITDGSLGSITRSDIVGGSLNFYNWGGPGALDSFWVKLRCGV
jgi:hypothetical protein